MFVVFLSFSVGYAIATIAYSYLVQPIGPVMLHIGMLGFMGIGLFGHVYDGRKGWRSVESDPNQVWNIMSLLAKKLNITMLGMNAELIEELKKRAETRLVEVACGVIQYQQMSVVHSASFESNQIEMQMRRDDFVERYKLFNTFDLVDKGGWEKYFQLAQEQLDKKAQGVW